MEFKGTKGKWFMMKGGFSKKYDDPNLIQIYATNENLEMICKVHKDQILHNDVKDFEANAKLIAAAPEMFEEIKETITDLKILRNQITLESKTVHHWEGMPELIDKWIERKEQLLTKITE